MSHIHCPECGFQNPEASNYCSKCGALLPHDEPGAHTTMTFTPEQANGPSAYLPYAARYGLYSGSWEHFHGLLDLYWLPYLDGKVSFETAMARLAAEM